MDIVSRFGVGIVVAEKVYHASGFAAYLHYPVPKRYKKVREFQNWDTGYARLVRWVNKLHDGRELSEGPHTPFRIVLLENEYSQPLLDYLARLEEPIGNIDILTHQEVLAIAATLRHEPEQGLVDAEFVARLSVERRDFIEWVEELGLEP